MRLVCYYGTWICNALGDWKLHRKTYCPLIKRMQLYFKYTVTCSSIYHHLIDHLSTIQFFLLELFSSFSVQLSAYLLSKLNYAIKKLCTFTVRRQWVREEDLAKSLKLHSKQLRRILRFFEEEKLVTRDHRKEVSFLVIAVYHLVIFIF